MTKISPQVVRPKTTTLSIEICENTIKIFYVLCGMNISNSVKVFVNPKIPSPDLKCYLGKKMPTSNTCS